jgi:hypothetical protein
LICDVAAKIFSVDTKSKEDEFANILAARRCLLCGAHHLLVLAGKETLKVAQKNFVSVARTPELAIGVDEESFRKV